MYDHVIVYNVILRGRKKLKFSNLRSPKPLYPLSSHHGKPLTFLMRSLWYLHVHKVLLLSESLNSL